MFVLITQNSGVRIKGDGEGEYMLFTFKRLIGISKEVSKHS